MRKLHYREQKQTRGKGGMMQAYSNFYNRLRPISLSMLTLLRVPRNKSPVDDKENPLT